MKNKRLDEMIDKLPEYVNRGGAIPGMGGLLHGEMLLSRYRTSIEDKKRQ